MTHGDDDDDDDDEGSTFQTLNAGETCREQRCR